MRVNGNLMSMLVLLGGTAGAHAPLSAQGEQVRICLLPAAVEGGSNAAAGINAVRESFASFLSGPSVTTEPVRARLESQAREEARQAGCPFLLITRMELVKKRSGGGMIGQMAAGAARQGAWEAGVRSRSAVGRIAGSAASGGINATVHSYVSTIRNKDELTLDWRLEAADGTVRAAEREKKRAASDGEDLLTPLVQRAAEQIVAAAKK